MVAIMTKTTIRQVYQYLNGGMDLYDRALIFGVRYPGFSYLAASLWIFSLLAGVRSEDTYKWNLLLIAPVFEVNQCVKTLLLHPHMSFLHFLYQNSSSLNIFCEK